MTDNVAHSREEILLRLEQRDKAFALFATGFTAIAAVAFSQYGTPQILLAIPFLAFAVSLFSTYHDAVLQYLHDYVATASTEGWDVSKDRQAYLRSKFRVAYALAQTGSFFAGSAFSLFMNSSLLRATDNPLNPVWWIDVVLTAVTLLLIWGMWIWRHHVHEPATG